MSKVDQTQVKVGVEIKVLWRAMSRDIRYVVPKTMPDLVDEVQLLEGDGGLGSILLFKLKTDLLKMSYQREKIVDLDDSKHEIALQVIEGGYLNHGFSSYTTAFKLTAVTEAETLIDVKVIYDFEAEETHKPGETIKATLTFIRCLEDYLSKQEMLS